MVDYLFTHTIAHRLEALTDAANGAERHALRRVGFDEEGVLRTAIWRAGSWRDLVLCSRLRPGGSTVY